MLQSKDIEELNGYKNKTGIYAAYKKTDLKTHTQFEGEGMGKSIPCNHFMKYVNHHYAVYLKLVE